MPSIKNWWAGEIDWATPAGQLLQKFLVALPKDRPFHFTLYGSAPLQLTVHRQLMSGAVDLFSDDDEDLTALVAAAKLDKTHGGFYLEPGFELSFRTSPRWRQRAKTVQRDNVTLTIPHPVDILIGKLDRLDAKDLKAFERTIQLTGHPTADELKRELQNAVDLFRPAFDDDSPNRYPENTRKLWRELSCRDRHPSGNHRTGDCAQEAGLRRNPARLQTNTWPMNQASGLGEQPDGVQPSDAKQFAPALFAYETEFAALV